MKIREFIDQEYDVVVIGAGHAGCEAALACARLGHKTMIATISMESVADLPCNPNIGGTGKGHLVREVDALGGEMGINIDKAFIQSRMLNTSKGPAVHSLRVQADKHLYHTEMKRVLEAEEHLDLVQTEIKRLDTDPNGVVSVVSTTGALYPAKAVIVASGTYLNGLILMGELKYTGGPHGMAAALELSDSLVDQGIHLRRFKTGTPARVDRMSIDFSQMEVQPGDDTIIPFSFMNTEESVKREQVDCYLTYTTQATKDIIEENLRRSPMYSGEVEGVGPRYCPSIEDKVVRFKEREEHQVFLEPEGLDTNEMYAQGVSSTLPYEVQKEFYRTIRGLENVKIMRPAYGIEYDCIDSTDLKLTLEHKKIPNLFFAGQINGSSGYEEAAAQGIIAGINAHCKLTGKESFILDRSDAYIGVLIDDLVTKGTAEPYRMMTSRAEYRLTLRQDNADLRLTEKSYRLGLATEERYQKMAEKRDRVEEEMSRLRSVPLTPTAEINEKLLLMGTSAIKTAVSLYDLIKRPEVLYDAVAPLDPNKPELSREVRLQVETQIKYEGYIAKQMSQIEQFKKLEHRSLEGIGDYREIKGLSNEGVQKLNDIRPHSLGQASRISGVSPADINVILIFMEVQRRRSRDESLKE